MPVDGSRDPPSLLPRTSASNIFGRALEALSHYPLTLNGSRIPPISAAGVTRVRRGNRMKFAQCDLNRKRSDAGISPLCSFRDRYRHANEHRRASLRRGCSGLPRSYRSTRTDRQSLVLSRSRFDSAARSRPWTQSHTKHRFAAYRSA